MTDHPLGNPDPATTDTHDLARSIVDTVLDLDEILSADVRRAEKIARICGKPHLEARLDEIDAELAQLTDPQGRPLTSSGGPGGDRAIGATGGDDRASELAEEAQRVQAEMAAAMHTVRMRQVPDDDWAAFETKHREALDSGGPYPNEMWNELIAISAIEPKMTVEQVERLRAKLGRPSMLELGTKAWAVNTNSGVSVPKSLLSSVVLSHTRRGRS